MLFLVSFIAVLAFYIGLTSMQVPAYQYRWFNCLDYLKEGTLYGGQPECVQPPMVYFTGSLISVFGDEYLHMLSNFTLILLNTFCLYLTLRMTKGRRYWVAGTVILVYCLLILPLSVEYKSSPGKAYLDTVLSACFMMAGVYVFLNRKSTNHVALASLMFALALMSKLTVLSVVVGCFTVLLLSHAQGMLKLSRDDLYLDSSKLPPLLNDAAAFLTPMLASFILLKLIFPNIIVYTVLCHTFAEQIGYVDTVKAIVTTNPLSDNSLLVFYALLAGVAAYYRRSRDGVALMYLVASPLTFVSVYKLRSQMPDVFSSYYAVLPIFLLPLILGNHASSLKGNRKKMACAVLVAAALFFGNMHFYGQPNVREIASMKSAGYSLKGIFYDLEDVEEIRETVDTVYMLLPSNSKKVLIDGRMYDTLRAYETDLVMPLVDWRSAPQDRVIDSVFAPGLIHYGVLSKEYNFTDSMAEENISMEKYDYQLSLYIYEMNQREEELIEDIESGEYEMIIIGPAAWSTHIWYLLSTQISPKTIQGYCRVYLPVFNEEKHLRHWSTILMQDQSKCNLLGNRAKSYMEAVFDSVCQKDEWAANYLLRRVFAMNTVTNCDEGGCKMYRVLLDKECKSGANVLGRYMNAKQAWDPRRAGVVAFAVLWLLIHVRLKAGFKDNYLYVNVRD
ncbi:MAG: hypothetical protein GF416_03540 [Candidatus Altiarchaeales archaeon]|nr:hypothetical protein [Candidatus Altiarchaeales archaeon]MBD3416192.1 hypothetical protein [Candidatus Altiarchaeales archaeon]